MATISDIFANAGSAWEPLTTLFQRIERELCIQREDAITALRAPLESLSIQTDVVGWNPHDLGRHVRLSGWTLHWAVERADGTGYRVSEEGWKHFDFERGTLNRHPVRVLWTDVLHALIRLTGTRSHHLPARTSALQEHVANDPKARAALEAMTRYAEQRFEASGGQPAKRDDVARHASRDTGYPVYKAIRLHRLLPEHLRNPPPTLRS